MLTAFLVAAPIAFIFMGGWVSMWLWRVEERRREWWDGVEQFRADRYLLASGTLQLDYAVAVGHTLVRNEITSHDTLVAALDRRPPVLEVVA